MRRLGRWMLNAMTLFSPLLCVATVALWVRNVRTREGVRLSRGDWETATASQTNQAGAMAYAGRIGPSQRSLGFDLQYADDPASRHTPPDDLSDYHRVRPSSFRVDYDGRFPAGGTFPDWCGFAWRIQADRTKPEWDVVRTLTVPAWSVLLACDLLPARWLRRRLQSARDEGGCLVCRYDLTGNASGVSPERGTMIGTREAPRA